LVLFILLPSAFLLQEGGPDFDELSRVALAKPHWFHPTMG
jgi:hypothetical protein